MMWMFYREGEYLSCEVRTCLDRQGYELVVRYPHAESIEWFAEVPEVERRWVETRQRLDVDGWQDMYGARPRPFPVEKHSRP